MRALKSLICRGLVDVPVLASVIPKSLEHVYRSMVIMARRRVIVDVDVGTDDYLALLLLLHDDNLGKIKIEAIIATAGNTTVDNVVVNIVRLLELVQRTDIPVYRGSNKELITTGEKIPLFHGSDGFGDLHYSTSPNLDIVKSQPGALALIELIAKYPNEISLICTAPLTNLALALRLDENVASNTKDLWIMGGNYKAVGNITYTAEFNFYFDPEAAYIVFQSFKKPIHIVTWETCISTNMNFDWRFNVFGRKEKPEIQLLNKAEAKVYEASDCEFWWPCDAFVAAAFLCPERIIEKESHHFASVELHGGKTRGQVVLDHLQKFPKNISIIETINIEIFKDLLMAL